MIRTFLIYKLIDRCIDSLFDRWTGLFVDPNEVVKSIEVGKFYREIYSIFHSSALGVNCRVENWFGSATVVAKTASYIELQCKQMRQVYQFDDHESALRYTSGRTDSSYHNISLFSHSKGTVEKVISDDLLRHVHVDGNEVHTLCYMQTDSNIPINITVKPDGIMSITP